MGNVWVSARCTVCRARGWFFRMTSFVDERWCGHCFGLIVEQVKGDE